MRARRVVIELLPTRVDVVVYDGRSRQLGSAPLGVRIPAQLSATTATWLREVRLLGPKLHAAIEQLGAKGLPATVVYRSPTQAVDLADIELSSASEACEAARLSIFESLPYTEVSAVCRAACVARDHGGEKQRRHVVVAAERDDVAGAIVQFVEEAGLKFAHSVPVNAAITAMAVRECLAEGEGRRAILYIGEYSSMFLLADNGCLLFSRRIGLGVELLASTLTRPLAVDNEGDDATSMLTGEGPAHAALDHETARSIILSFGIPEREAVLHKASRLKGAHVIPVIQPLLQRFLLELRQSLRFGVGEELRRGLSITCMGPGSAVPNLARLVGDELGATITTTLQPAGEHDEAACAIRDKPGAIGSEMSDATQDRALLDELNVQPAERAKVQHVNHLKRWLISGAAAALLVVAFDAIRIGVNVSSAQRHAAALASRSASDDALRMTQNRLEAAISAMRLVEQAIDYEVGRTVDTHAVMHELAALTPDSIRFTSINFSAQSQPSRSRSGEAVAGTDGLQMTGRLTGFARRSTTQNTNLRSFIDQLRDSALFDAVVLGDVHAGVMDGAEGERFETTLVCVSMPAEMPWQSPSESMDVNPGAGSIASVSERSGHE